MSFIKKYGDCLEEFTKNDIEEDMQDQLAIDSLLMSSWVLVKKAKDYADKNKMANEDLVKALDMLMDYIEDTERLNQCGIDDLKILMNYKDKKNETS